MWFYLYTVGLPVGILVAAVPIKKVRRNALLGREREKYLRRVFLISAWGLLLLVIGVQSGRRENEVWQFWLIVCGPGVVLALVRLCLESRYLGRVVHRNNNEMP
jgi:hypothetical protein